MLGLLTCSARAQTNCVPVPSGAVSWWRADGNAVDWIDNNHGTIAGQATFGPGRRGQSFIFDGNADAISLGNPTNLQLQNFTIEAWVRRASTTRASFDFNGGIFLGYGGGGYGFGMLDNGTLFLTRIGVDNVTSAVTITDTNFHHLAVTKVGTNVVFYVDGTAYPAPLYSTTYTFGTPAAVGARGDGFGNSFFGAIDELAIYNRALSRRKFRAYTPQAPPENARLLKPR